MKQSTIIITMLLAISVLLSCIQFFIYMQGQEKAKRATRAITITDTVEKVKCGDTIHWVNSSRITDDICDYLQSTSQ